MAGIDPSYVDVAERIREFKTAYPTGSLQQVRWSIETVPSYINGNPVERTFIAYTAAAYRTPDDERPGIGTAWEPFPGPTNFTRDSELMNAETSAWGRAIVAALASETKRIATAEDVRNRQAAVADIDAAFEKAAKPDPGVSAVAAAFDAKPLTENDIANKSKRWTWPFKGDEYGLTIDQLSDATIKWGLANRFDPDDAQWGDRNQRTRKALEAELAKRGAAQAA